MSYSGISSVKLIAVSVVLLVMTACTPEPSETERSLDGSWTLASALRNDRSTNSLEGLYMEIMDERQMNTNLLGDTMIYDVVVGEKVLQLSSEPPYSIEILQRTDSTMQLRMKVGKQEIKMNMMRR